MPHPIGVIAGQGRLPILEAQGIRAAGHAVACVGLSGQFDPALPDACDCFARSGIIRMGRWIRLLRRWGACEAILVGRVRKARMYEPLRMMRQMPDRRAFKIWYRVLRQDRRSHALLGAIANELERCGITLIDTTRFIQEQLAHAGVMTRTQPNAAQRSAVERALPVLLRLADLDIGQAVAVQEDRVIAVEAIEGTDQMIARAGDLSESKPWLLLKVAKPDQDLRFDVPSVGLRTIEQLKSHHATCLAVEAGRTIIVDKAQTLAAADEAGIAVVGIESGGAAE